MKRHITPYNTVIVIGILLAGLLGFTLYQLYRQSYTARDRVIVDHVAELHRILTQIDGSCEIIAIRRNHSSIDFLQVAKFAGTEIGPLQLRYPEKWHGPYLEQNPTVQEIPYELVKTRDGFVIAPGTGVMLSNGKIMGKDIVLNETTDIDLYMNEVVGLEFESRPLVMKLSLAHTVVRPKPSALEMSND